MSGEAWMVTHFAIAIFMGWCADVAREKGYKFREYACVYFAFTNFILGVTATWL